MKMKIRITEDGKKPYITEVNEKIGRIYLAKDNPKFKYELVEEKTVVTKKELDSKLEGLKSKIKEGK